MAIVLAGPSPCAIKILELFGVKDPGKLKEAHITFKSDDLVYIDTTRAVEVNDIVELEMEFKKYKLVEVDEDGTKIKKED